jgi:hypothetical protein
VEREFAAGRGRMDLAVLYAGVWNIVEIKLVHPQDGFPGTEEEGLSQIVRYRDTIDSDAPCYLVIFDRTEAGKKREWQEKLTWNVRQTPSGPVTVVGC